MNPKTVLLIEDSPEYAELIRRWLGSQADTDFVLIWADSLIGGLNHLKKGGMDVVLLDLGLPDSRGLETFNTTRMHASGIPIIILSSGDKQSLAVQMVQRGAQDYIIKDICDSDLLVKALQFAVGTRSPTALTEAAGHEGTVIGVMGVKGGVGVTTLACNLAAALRRETGQNVLLADLDLNGGLVGLFMNTETEYSILDVIANGPHTDPANPSFWEGMVGIGPDGVDIMRSPGPRGFGEAEGHRVREALALIRSFYCWTLLDLGRMTGLSLSLLGEVSELYLVTMLSVPALYEAKRTINALARAGLAEDRLRLIVNDVGSKHVSGTELRGLFGVPVYARLPAAAQELDDACAHKELPGVDSDYRAQIANLARRAAGLEEAKTMGAVSRLRSFADMFRGNP